MIDEASFLIHFNKFSLILFLTIAVILGVVALWKRSYAMRAQAWPTIAAKIENVFLNVETHGTKIRYQITHAVLAYSYSVGESFYSGEIELQAGDRVVKKLESELVGQQVMVHYNPRRPAVSLFLKSSVKGWQVGGGPSKLRLGGGLSHHERGCPTLRGFRNVALRTSTPVAPP